MDTLRVSLVQTDILWEDAPANLERYAQKLRALKGQTDLAVLPEVCANGFGCEAAAVAQGNDGLTISTLRRLAAENGMAVTGSFIACDDENDDENGSYYNRGFFLYPDGRAVFFDKSHLFRMGSEGKEFEAGPNRPVIVPYLGWNIRPVICYDLRFPVYCRNRQLPGRCPEDEIQNPDGTPENQNAAAAPDSAETDFGNFEYDLMTVVANWPESRIRSWSNMLEARAAENQAYVCGVNRVGDDGLGIHYNGGSAVFDAIGREMLSFLPDEEGVKTVTLSKERLHRRRRLFPAWRDADRFELLPSPTETAATPSGPARCNGIRLIGFDADDTLWENARYFVEAEREYARLLAPWAQADEVHRRLVATETRNMEWYGYGAMAYTLSLVENAVSLTKGQVSAQVLGQVVELGRAILAHPLELKPDVERVLPLLRSRYRLIMITKGDMLDQERKLSRSGLTPCFHHIEIVTEKHTANYRRILRQLDVRPEEFLMVGNSVKSDIAPVLEIGAQAVLVGDGKVWEFERTERPSREFRQISRLGELLSLLPLGPA